MRISLLAIWLFSLNHSGTQESLNVGFLKKPCDNGWIAYDESCYLIGRTIVTFKEAKAYCKNLGGNLFVPDSLGEWDTIRPYLTRSLWSWIGLRGQINRQGIVVPRAVVRSDYDPENLPWLVNSPGHGFSSVLRCVSYFSSPDLGTAYIHYYDCNIRHFFVCEKNDTLMTRIWPETASRKPIAPRRTTTVATTTVKPVLRDSEEEYMEDNEAFYPPETPKPATLPPAINYRSTRRPRLSITEAEEDPEEDA